jgi:hypothetical protein
VTGSAVEIGVFAGKLFTLLHLLLHDDELSLAIDLFGDQDRNVDRSGYGSELDRFLATVERHVGSTERVRTIAGSSLDVRPADVLDAVGPARLFSVDGGHTTSITAHDLAVADGALADEGVVMLDDAFNAKYPGVSDGFHSYVCRPDTSLRPFAVAVNKLFLCRPQHVDRYRDELARRASDMVDREEVLTGSTVAIMRRLRPREVLTRTEAWQRVRERPAGRAAREVVRRLPVHRARHRS